MVRKTSQLLLGLLALVAVACGNTRRHGENGQLPATGGSDSGPEPGAAGEPGTAGAPATKSCLYPVEKVAPLIGEKDVLDFTLSSPQRFEVDSDTWGGVAAAYDLNRDWVSDVIFEKTGPEPGYGLAVSLPPMSFGFEEVDCPELAQLPPGRIFLRDLDADGVLDFIVGHWDGIKVFLNHEFSLDLALDFQSGPHSSLINVAAADLDRDGRTDLVVGYDNVVSEAHASFETGVLSFLQVTEGQLQKAGGQSTMVALGPINELYTGYFALAHSSDDRYSVIAGYHNGPDGGTLMRRVSLGEGSGDGLLQTDEMPEDVAGLFAMGGSVVAAVGNQTFYVFDVEASPPALLGTHPLHYQGGLTHEPGGGPERPRYRFYDFDRDGDLDFIEDSLTDAQFAIHMHLDGNDFAEPQLFDVNIKSNAEAPFVMLGPGTSVVGLAPDGSGPSLYTLFRQP